MADEIEASNSAERAEAIRPALTLPLILTLVALLIYFSFQTLSLLNERSNLAFVKRNQDGALQEAQKVQAQFKVLVTKTSDLADQGHAGARMVMEGLQSQGVGVAPTMSAPMKPARESTK